MDGLQGDFLGFQFNGVTSKELGITRVSDGDRYQDILTPEINDRTVEMPGVDGMYFYGSDFKQKTFSVKIAFDGVTEEQLKKIKRTFIYKHIGNLIFSEWPYKVYRVKVASPPELDYVCFNEPNGSGDTYTISTTRKEKYPVLFNGSNETIDTFPILLNTTVTTSEDIETLFEEIVSTALDYPSLIDESTLYVTFDGVEYECPQQDYSFDNVTGYDYGAQWSDSLEDYDWSEYPFSINSEIDGGGTLYNTLYTAINGEHSIIIKKKEVINRNYVIEEEKPITQRIYKGEGTIEFVAYYPFARQKYRILDTYVAEDLGEETVTDEEINEWLLTNQWAAASGIQKASWFSTMDVDGNTKISTKVMESNNNDGSNNVITLDSNFIGIISVTVQGVSTTDYTRNNNVLTFDTNEFPNPENNVVVTYATNRINVYNPGDLPTGFRLYLPFDNNKVKSFTMTYDAGSYGMTENHILNMQEVTKKDNDIGIQINTTNGLIEGVSAISNMSGVNDGVLTSGNIYNEYVTGEFFKIVCSDGPTDLRHIDLTGQDLNTGSFTGCQIYYNYLYL